MTIETAEDLIYLKEIGRIVALAIRTMSEAIQPGITTLELDRIGLQVLEENGARSAPQLMYDFPGVTCISINHKVAHGIPDQYCLQAGDLINIDVSAEKNGYFGDSGSSFVVAPASSQRQNLCKAGQKILSKAISKARHGAPLNIIGKTIEREAKRMGYSVIRNLGSHGVGRSLHEEPKFIAPYSDPSDHRVLTEGMVITIEPFISTGAIEVDQASDGWTLYTKPQFDTVQFEHSMVITRGSPLILTPFTAA